MTKAGGLLTAGLTLPIAAAGVKMFQMAADAEDATSAMNVVFGESAGVIEKWSKDAATGMGLTSTEAKKAATDLAIFGKAGGLAGKELTEFATQQSQLSSDLASFKGTSVEEAMTAIGAAYRGEMEPIRAYGVLLDQQKIKEEAVSLGLVKSGEELDNNAKLLATRSLIMKATVDQQGDFARTADGAANKMKILTAQIKEQATGIGVQLLPLGQKALGFLSGLLEKFNSLGPSGQKLAVVFGGIAAAIGPALLIFGKLIQSFSLIKGVLAGLSFNPIVLGITLAAGALVLLWKNSETFRNIVTGAFNAVKDVVSGVFAFIETVITTFAGRWNDPDIVSDGWVGKIEAVVVFVRAAFDSLMAWWNGIWPQFSEAFSHTWNVIQGIFEVAISVITTLWRVWGDDLMTILNAVWTIISGIVEGAINVVKGIIQTVLAIINGDWSRAWEGIKMIFSGVWTAIKAIVEGALGIIKGVIGAAWDAVRNLTSSAWEGIKSAVANAIGNLLGEVRAIPGKITSALGNLGSLLYNAGKDIVQGMINGVKSMGRTLVNAIVSLIPGPVRGVVQKALGIGSPSKVFKGFGQNIMEGLVLGLQDRSSNLNQQMSRIANQVSLGESPSLNLSGTATNQRALTPVAQTAAPVYEVSVTLPDRAVKLSLDSADPMSLKRFIEQLAELLQRREASFA